MLHAQTRSNLRPICQQLLDTSTLMQRAARWPGTVLRSTKRLNYSFGARFGPLHRPARPTSLTALGYRNLSSLTTTKTPFVIPPAMEIESSGNFDLLKRVDVAYSPITVSKWRSRVTGLTVVHIDYEGNAALFLYSPFFSSMLFVFASSDRQGILCRRH